MSTLLNADNSQIKVNAPSINQANFEKVINIVNSSKLKFLTLNVCGITSKLKFQNIQELFSQYDIICLSEVRTSFIDPSEFPDFKVILSESKCKKRGVETGKLTGIAILIRICDTIKYEMIKTNCEWILWLKVVINNFIFLLGSVYIPCETSIYYCDSIYDVVAEDLLEMSTKFDLPFLLMGDFNSRTGTLCDTLRYEKELILATGIDEEPTSYVEQFNLLQRYSQDKGVNNNGKSLISLCKSFNLRILNGRFGLDKGVGNYTCHHVKGESVVDYIIASDNLIPHVSDCGVDPLDKTLSDIHSALTLSISYGPDTQQPVTPSVDANSSESNNETTQPHKTYYEKWNVDLEPLTKRVLLVKTLINC